LAAASARSARAALMALMLAPWPAVAQTAEPQRPLSVLEAEAEAQPPATVVIGGEPVIVVTVGAGQYTTEVRASRIAARIHEVISDRTIGDPTVTVTDVEGSSELRAGSRLLMVVTAPDARSLGVARATLAETYARQIETVIRNERLRRAPGALLRSGISGLIATAAFVLIVWLILRLTRWLRGGSGRWRTGRLVAQVENTGIVPADWVGRGIDKTLRLTRLILLLLAFDLYLTCVLGLFPWTRAVSYALLGYVVDPARMAARAFIGYVPNLLFVLVIAVIFRGIIRLVAVFFRQIEQGRVVFQNFPPEWATPTYKIVRLLLVAFGLVVVFPYLPASDSAAFAGVSVFLGVLLSLSSSSAIANAIAGVVLTYTGAFRLGDRVKLGDNFGDIVETSMLVTRMRTIKNEDVTIPNSLVLSASMTNYSRQAGTLGLVLHTSVTIGYDAPWRQIHALLLDAALKTPEILETPAPFVWQTALNDFYVTYEINAYTANARDMIATYALLHANIQDTFFAAGVEIMSPHFTSVRDGNTVAIPEANRPAGYRAGAFRVEQVERQP
jgi:small-conductance mechanosensitive channel